MLLAWRDHGRHFDVFTERGYFGFLGWYAFVFLRDRNLPYAFLPDDLITLLNLPVMNESVPLTVGMVLNERGIPLSPGRLAQMSRPELFAHAFVALEGLLSCGDVRLIPSYVSGYWRRYLDSAAPVTVYEYVAAMCVRNFTGPQPDPAALRSFVGEAFRNDYIPQRAGMAIFSDGYEAAADSRAADVTLDPNQKGIIVYRDFETICGLAKAGKQAADALTQAGYSVTEVDYAIPRNRMAGEYEWNAHRLYNSRRNVHIVNLNPEYVPECLALHGSKIHEKDYIIGQFYWELSSIGDIHELALELVDEIWVASQYLAEVYGRSTSKPVINMGQAVETATVHGLTRKCFGLPDDSYLFLFAFDAYSSIERKNPAATIRAFQAAFPSGSERAGLVFKTRNTGTVSEASDPMQWQTVVRAAAADKRIRIIDETYSDERMRALVNCCDCYVSLHRSEGFGYGPAEAMLDGKPVIVTAYSGVTDFCTDTTAFPIPFQLAPTPYGAYPFMNRTREYVWADADTAAASAVMRMLFEHPEKGRSVGERARAFMRKRYSLSALAGRYRSRLQALGFYPNRLQMATSESH